MHKVPALLLLSLAIGCGDSSDTRENDAGKEGPCGSSPCASDSEEGGACLNITCTGSLLDPLCDGCRGALYCGADYICTAPVRDLGEPCSSDAQCTPYQAYCEGTCKPYGLEGNRCFYDEDQLASLVYRSDWPFVTNIDGLMRCEPNLDCDAAGKCVFAGIGQPCLDGACREGRCNETTLICEHIESPPEPCGGCALGMSCDEASMRCVANAGGTCEATADCKAGLSCLAGPVQIGSDFFTEKRCRYTTEHMCTGIGGCLYGCLAECAKCEEMVIRGPLLDEKRGKCVVVGP